MPTIRPSTDHDLDQIAAIYAHHVRHGTGTFEITAPDVTEMGKRRLDVLNKGLPYLVIAEAQQVLGFAYCNWFKPRPAYRFSAEDSIYLAPGATQRGLGSRLLAELCIQAEIAGVRSLIAVIGDSNNTGSIKVHQRLGFDHVGTLKACGWKFERWLDVVMMQKTLGPGASQPPV
jgi:L-amino acid N-acyltransferase YncA